MEYANMAPQLVRKEISISSEAFDEMTGALADAGIKLDKDDSFTITKDISIKGPILYRQVNLRHQILSEVVKVYKTPLDKDGKAEINDAEDFIGFLDATYKYILTGVPPEVTSNTQTKITSWGKK